MRRTHIPIISLMRSGSSELVADLALNSPVAMRSLGEPFNERRGSTFKGVPGDPSKNDPLKLLRAKATRNMTASRFFVFKVFSGHLALPQLGRLLSTPTVCPVVLERSNATERACSLAYARQTNDWSGHERKGGKGSRWHPTCEKPATASDLRERLAAERAQQTWFANVRKELQQHRRPHLWLTMEFVAAERRRALDAIYGFCGVGGATNLSRPLLHAQKY